MPKKPSYGNGSGGNNSGHSDQIFDGRGDATRLVGGRGNDVFYVDDLGDEVIEKKNAGIDTVISEID